MTRRPLTTLNPMVSSNDSTGLSFIPQDITAHLTGMILSYHCHVYNRSVNPCTGCSPFCLMFGSNAEMPDGNDVWQVSNIWGKQGLSNNFSIKLQERLQQVNSHVCNQMGYKPNREKDIYNKKAHGMAFQPDNYISTFQSHVHMNRQKISSSLDRSLSCYKKI